MGDQGQPKHIHFGSLEEKEKARLEAIKGNDASATGSAAIQAAVRAGNINIAEAGKTQVMELTDTSREAQDRQALLLRKLEAEKRKRSLVVPTKPTDVIDWLRKHGQPVALFGETVADRRERLREYLAAVEVDGYLAAAAPPGAAAPAAPTTAPAAATAAAVGKAGGEGLLGAAPPSALAIASVPLPSKQQQQQEERMEEQKEGEGEEEGRAEKKQELFYAGGVNQSQLGDDRPLAAVGVSPCAGFLATGAWTHTLKVWDLKGGSLDELVCCRGHMERVCGLAWMPLQGGGHEAETMEVDSPSSLKLASCSVDGTARLWSVCPGQEEEGKVLRVFEGHAARLASCAFHPSGRYLGTTSWDYTWRLWDVETGQELLLQDGHYKETHAIAFQGDGALVVTGDYAGIGHVWDMRTGKSIFQLHGHTQKVLCADWHPNGYQFATGSSENVVKIWDMRRRANIYTIPAHSALVAAVKYAPQDGEFLATASFDGKAKVWGTRDFRLLRTLEGHEGRVVDIDWTPDGRRLVTASHDRTFKVWADSKEF
ncbi:u4 u6 small nuclear ribonucleoprotein [Nannochloropsis oceanica]